MPQDLEWKMQDGGVGEVLSMLQGIKMQEN